MPEIDPDVEFVLDPSDGSTSVTTVDLLEDYWADFLYFRKEASSSASNEDKLRAHRFLRAGLFTFLNYMTGLANRWERNGDQGDRRVSSPGTIGDRLARLAEQLHSSPPPCSDLDHLTALAIRCSDLVPADEKDLFQDLEFDRVNAAQGRVVVWLEEFVRLSDLLLPENPRSVAGPLTRAFDGPTKASYHDFEALGDDPHPFQDPPGTWVHLEPSPDDGRDQE